MPLILLEGLDGTGKSTLAEQLSSAKGWPVVNIFEGEDKEYLESLGIKKETYHEDIYFMDNWISLGKPSCILDRGIISGWVYSKSNTLHKVQSSEAMEYWMRRMEPFKKEIFIIFLDTHSEVIIERDEIWKGKEGQLSHDRNKFFSARHSFLRNGFQCQTFDTTFKSPDITFKEVEQWLSKFNL